MYKTVHRATRRTVSKFISLRNRFNANGTLFGNEYLPSDFGSLPKKYWSDIELDSQEDDFYVVISYQTPIAWFADSMWHVPNVNYSITTTKHLHSTGIPCRHGETRESDKWIKVAGQ